jgi:hypothetical protein
MMYHEARARKEHAVTPYACHQSCRRMFFVEWKIFCHVRTQNKVTEGKPSLSIVLQSIIVKDHAIDYILSIPHNLLLIEI